MGGCLSSVKQELKPTEYDPETDSGFNSLELDSHVNPGKSKQQFDTVKALIKNRKDSNLKCRGLTYIGDGYNGDVFCKVDLVIADEKAVQSLLQVLLALKGKIAFTSVILSGDNYKNKTNEGIKFGVAGFATLMEIFAKGHFEYVTEFKLNNFEPEPTPFLAFVDASLANNPIIKDMSFFKNRLNQDMCAAILQRIYFNQSLNNLNLGGNNITIASFKKEVVDKYFNSRTDIEIIYD